MKNLFLITKYSIKEIFSRKIFIAFLGVSSFILLIAILLSLFISVDSLIPDANVEAPSEVLNGSIVMGIKITIAASLYSLGLLLAVFSVSSIIPNMLEKGSIDLLLSKPLARYQLILGNFTGGMIVVLVNVAYLIFGIYLLIAFKFDIWDGSFLLSIFTITFSFASLYSMIILIGILTQSSVFAMMVSYFILLILSPVLALKSKIGNLINNDFVNTIIDGIYYIIPKTAEIGGMTNDIAIGGTFELSQPLISTFIFIILTLVLSIIIFNKKDY